MKWPELTRNNILAGAFAMFLTLSVAALHAAPLGLGPLMTDSDATADVGDTTGPTNPNATGHHNQTVTLNCSTIADRQMTPGSRNPPNTLTTSAAALPAPNNESSIANGRSPSVRARPGYGNGTSPTSDMRRVDPLTVRETCRLIEQLSPPEWVTEMAATAATESESGQTNDGADTSLDAYTNTSPGAQAQLSLARDLREVLTDESRSRRGVTFDAAELALAERRAMAANGHLNTSVTLQLAAQQTKLRGARALLMAAESDTAGQSGTLSRTAKLTELGIKVQAARLNTDIQPTDPTDTTLPETTMPEHDAPSAAAFAILNEQNVEVTTERAAEIRALDELSEPTRRELTNLLDAYLGYYWTVQTSTGANESRVRAAQLQLIDAAADLEAALETTDGSGSAGRVSNAPVDPGVNITGVLSIDLARDDNTYTEDYHLQIDAGGDDTYNNNAGGANASGNSTEAAALIDLGGADTYNGRNGGARYIRTKQSPSVPDPRIFLPKKGEAAGFLLDAGTSNDTYTASNNNGTNGGGRRAIGFLVDSGGQDTYDGRGKGTNGAAYKKASGFLLDAGTGGDIYAGGRDGVSNAGTNGGHGFLFDVGGNDTYEGSNGGSHRGVLDNWITNWGRQCEKNRYREQLKDKACQILYFIAPTPRAPESGGFLLDGGGSDTYEGSNGGAGFRGSAFLFDAGTGDDIYDGKNGRGHRRGSAGFLLDTGGDDKYLSQNGGGNGGARYGGVGFLMDGGAGNDTYNATTGNGPGARDNLPPGSLATNGGGIDSGNGFLMDGGGNDTYLAGSVGTNGGSSGNTKSSGFLFDAAGDDRYIAAEGGVNGGALAGTALLYDNAGSDFYNEYTLRCRDCSDIPKGTVGAQVDRGGGTEGNGQQPGSSEVLVVDDTAEAADADCPEASYQSIQQAVNDAEYGDTVQVCAGTYPGNVRLNTSNVLLRAADPGEVVLDGENGRQFGVVLLGGKTTVTGFTATNFSVGFLSPGPETTVANTTVRDSEYGIIKGGIFSDSLLRETPIEDDDGNSYIRDNVIRNAKFGIFIGGTGNVNVERNTVRATQYGIIFGGSSKVTIHNNTVTAHALPPGRTQRGIVSIRNQEITISDNTVTGFTAREDRYRPSGSRGGGFGIEIRTPVGRGEDATHTLRNNTMSGNTYNLYVTSARQSAYKYINIDITNSVNGNPVVYLVGAANTTIGPGATGKLPQNSSAVPDGITPDNPQLNAVGPPGYVACVRCVNVTVQNLELGHNGQGVLIVKSRGTQVDNVTIHDTFRGVSVHQSPTATSVKNTTIRNVFRGIDVRHKCGNKGDVQLLSIVRRVLRGNSMACANPSVVIANNTIRQTGFLVNKHGLDITSGQAITVRGTGVTVRRNTITQSFATGISMAVSSVPREPSEGNGLYGTGVDLNADAIWNSTVIDNSITNTSVGIKVTGSQGTTIVGNRITDSRVGLFSKSNNGLVYRDNVVENATTGMFIRRSEVELTARNNSFLSVQWGLDGQWQYGTQPPNAVATHDFGTSNSVNGERILWLNGTTHRTIDATNANMVVCIRCVGVTIRDMTITDNGHGVVLWDTTATRVSNVTVTDTLRTGVLIRGGRNNTVQNSTIIDSTLPIWASPINRRNLRKDLNSVKPGGPGRPDGEPSKVLGRVRIVNNRVSVDNAAWPTAPYTDRRAEKTQPGWWGHFGLILLRPTAATVNGNTITDNRWGIFSWGGDISNLRFENNTITHARKVVGMDRFGYEHMPPLWAMHGIFVKVNNQGNTGSNRSVEMRNNMLTAGTYPHGGMDHLWGMTIAGNEVPSTVIADNRVRGYEKSIRVGTHSNNSTISIRRNRFSGAKHQSVFIRGHTPGDAVEIHQNLLDPQAGHGVFYKKGGGGGGHMMGGGSGGGSSSSDTQPVNATCNRWGAPDGPSSKRMTLVDPVTGVSADGNGSAVSQGRTHHESNVRFHPWLGDSPRLTCQKAVVGTATPTPIPTPTRTPWPTVGAGDGRGSGSGDGPGPGTGNGTGPGGGDGPGPNRATGDGGGTGTITATVKVPKTRTATATPPPTATPEIVPGFGVAVWIVAVGLLVAVLAGRRRD